MQYTILYCGTHNVYGIQNCVLHIRDDAWAMDHVRTPSFPRWVNKKFAQGMEKVIKAQIFNCDFVTL